MQSFCYVGNVPGMDYKTMSIYVINPSYLQTQLNTGKVKYVQLRWQAHQASGEAFEIGAREALNKLYAKQRRYRHWSNHLDVPPVLRSSFERKGIAVPAVDGWCQRSGGKGSLPYVELYDIKKGFMPCKRKSSDGNRITETPCRGVHTSGEQRSLLSNGASEGTTKWLGGPYIVFHYNGIRYYFPKKRGSKLTEIKGTAIPYGVKQNEVLYEYEIWEIAPSAVPQEFLCSI